MGMGLLFQLETDNTILEQNRQSLTEDSQSTHSDQPAPNVIGDTINLSSDSDNEQTFTTANQLTPHLDAALTPITPGSPKGEKEKPQRDTMHELLFGHKVRTTADIAREKLEADERLQHELDLFMKDTQKPVAQPPTARGVEEIRNQKIDHYFSTFPLTPQPPTPLMAKEEANALSPQPPPDEEEDVFENRIDQSPPRHKCDDNNQADLSTPMRIKRKHKQLRFAPQPQPLSTNSDLPAWPKSQEHLLNEARKRLFPPTHDDDPTPEQLIHTLKLTFDEIALNKNPDIFTKYDQSPANKIGSWYEECEASSQPPPYSEVEHYRQPGYQTTLINENYDPTIEQLPEATTIIGDQPAQMAPTPPRPIKRAYRQTPGPPPGEATPQAPEIDFSDFDPIINSLVTDDLDDFNDLTLADMSAEGQHLTILKQRLTILRQQLQVHELAMATLLADHGPVSRIERDDVRRKILHTHKDRILRLKGHIQKYERTIQETEHVQSRFQTNLHIPKDTRFDVPFHIRDLTAAVPHCTKTDGVSNFSVMYNKLIAYGVMKGFSHANYKQAIKLLLNDPTMMDTFARNEDKPLAQIVALFKDLYVPSKTILDYSHQLDTFARQPGESLRSVRARFIQLLHETEHLYPEHQRQTRREMEVEQLLFNTASPKAAAHLKEIKARAQTRGQQITANQYLDAAEEAEHIYQDTPTVPIPNKSGPRPTVEQRHIPLFAMATQPATPQAHPTQPAQAQSPNVRPEQKPPLTGANVTPIGQQQTQQQTVPEQATARRPSPPCRHCNSTDPAHIWATCDKRPPRLSAPNRPQPPGSANKATNACFRCGGTHRHTWATCQGQKKPQNQNQPPQPPRPCPKCGGTHNHVWKTCTNTPLAVMPQRKTTIQPCYRCQSTILHNWRECNGIPPTVPQTSQACYRCGSNQYHKWNLCQGIPPNSLQDPNYPTFPVDNPNPQVSAIVYQQPQQIQHFQQPTQLPPQPLMQAQPALTYQIAPPQQQRPCYKCGGTDNHRWGTCTRPRLDGLPSTTSQPINQPSRPPRPCPHCSGTDRHDWKICADTIAAVANLNI